jgi:hypothetical protein
MSCLNSILCGIYILGSYAHLPPLLHPCPLSPLNPRGTYALAHMLILNLHFKATSFSSLSEDNTSPTSPLIAFPSLMPHRFFFLNTSFVVCLSVITLTLVILRSLLWCLSCTCILKPPPPISFQECCLTPPRSCSFPIPMSRCKS